jgi:hypothetical protein
MNQIQIYLPPPRDWQIFQDLIFELAKIKYKENTVQNYGRQGQKQNGVDIFATDYNDENIGLQCKETKSIITEDVIYDECNKAMHFSPILNTFIICTTSRTDVKLQNKVNEINGSKEYNFFIQIWFWETINVHINNYNKILIMLYSTYANEFLADDVNTHLRAIYFSFNRPAFRDNFSYERSYGDFEEALVNTKQLLRTGILFDRITKNVILQVVPTDLIGNKKYKKFLKTLENKLESIYQTYIKNKEKMNNDNKYAEDINGLFNIKRRELIERINKELKLNEIDEIKINY